MASIDPFLESTHSFDPEATQAMGEAFEAACRHIPDTGQAATTRELIARRIIENAKGGERDPARLCEAALIDVGLRRQA